MSQLPFIKMHGAENDYIYFDGFDGPLPADPQTLAPQICHRHGGIGADGLICLVPPSDDTCDVEMRIWNADGSAAKMCGNAARCIGIWMQQQGRIHDICRILIGDRVITAQQIQSADGAGSATVDMGTAELLTEAAGREVINVDGSAVTLHLVRVGNPHAVLFVDDLSDERVHSSGPFLEHHPDLPERTNVEFVRVTGPAELTVRVWERGSGETRACGSGACAVVAAATQVGHLGPDRPCRVILPGGTLEVRQQNDGKLLMSGPAVIAFTGELTVD